jgi:tetratricopeptide (TPR) repeat protein
MEKGNLEDATKSLEKALRMVIASDENTNIKPTNRICNPKLKIDANSLQIASYLNGILSCSFPKEYESAGESKTAPLCHKPEYEEGMDWFKNRPLRYEDSSKCLEGTILYNLGRISHDKGNPQDALEFYKRALGALVAIAEMKKQMRDDQLILAIAMSIGHIQYIWIDHDAAIQTFAIALAIARTLFGNGTLEEAACLNCIGVLNYVADIGDENKALEAFLSALHTRKTLLGRNHIDVGTVHNNIGRVFFQKAKFEEAKDSYMEALRIRRSHEPDSVDVAATLFNIAQVFHQQTQLEKALRLYQEFLQRAQVAFGKTHRDIAVVLTTIGAGE